MRSISRSRIASCLSPKEGLQKQVISLRHAVMHVRNIHVPINSFLFPTRHWHLLEKKGQVMLGYPYSPWTKTADLSCHGLRQGGGSWVLARYRIRYQTTILGKGQGIHTSSKCHAPSLFSLVFFPCYPHAYSVLQLRLSPE